MAQSKLPPDFDVRAFVAAVCDALADARAADLAIIPGVCAYVSALQVSPCGTSVGVASWTLSSLYNSRDNTAVLVACPDNLTAWNARKRALTCITDLEEELRFSELIIRRAPKSVEAWAHRNWTLRQMHIGTVDARKELDLAREMADKMFANYYAGVHRVRSLRRDIDIDAKQKVARWEVVESRTFLKTHPKDPSAWHAHRTALTIANADGRQKEEEHTFVADMMRRYGKDSQSIQCHHKWWARQRKVAQETVDKRRHEKKM